MRTATLLLVLSLCCVAFATKQQRASTQADPEDGSLTQILDLCVKDKFYPKNSSHDELINLVAKDCKKPSLKKQDFQVQLNFLSEFEQCVIDLEYKLSLIKTQYEDAIDCAVKQVKQNRSNSFVSVKRLRKAN